MVPKYAERITSLSPDEAGLVATELYRRRVFPNGLEVEVGQPLPAESLAGVLSGCRILAADVVAVLACVPGPVAQNALEKIMGRPITHIPPQPSPPPAPPHKGAVPEVRDYGPMGRRTIHRIQPNPKRAGTGAADRFDLYREGMTVAEYLEQGGIPRDVSWDARQKYIELRDNRPSARAAVVAEEEQD